MYARLSQYTRLLDPDTIVESRHLVCARLAPDPVRMSGVTSPIPETPDVSIILCKNAT